MTGSELTATMLASAITATHEEAHALLAPLEEYDCAHGGDLVRTLHVYLATGGNASASAEALFLHRSGLLYRLRRIESLLGLTLDAFPHRVALELAVLAVFPVD